jgi:ribosome maturation factor RimP
MTHPLIPQLIDLATPIAEQLGLEVVGAVFHTNIRPPVLRVDIRNSVSDTSLDDCERMSHALEAQLDAMDIIPDAYIWRFPVPASRENLPQRESLFPLKGFP